MFISKIYVCVYFRIIYLCVYLQNNFYAFIYRTFGCVHFHNIFVCAFKTKQKIVRLQKVFCDGTVLFPSTLCETNN